MSDWVILVDHPKDFPNEDTPHKVITTKDYLARTNLFRGSRPKIINLSRSFAYQSRGYYASLLAGARGHRVVPTVETMIDLADRSLYAQALPELEDQLVKARHEDGAIPARLLVMFGICADKRFDRFARLLFDWFRCPVLDVTIEETSRPEIRKLAAVSITRLAPDELAFFHKALHDRTRREWRSRKTRTPPRHSFAVLHDPREKMPPSNLASLKHWARIAEKMGVEVEPITRKDLARLAEFDALFIRETTSIDNHTYRFARRAVQEGMPVIDDPISMIRCTNKVYLQELMTGNGIAVPPTVILASHGDMERAADELGFPLVVKIPDSSFSRGVKKVGNAAEFDELAKAWFKDTDLLLAQKFMPTDFDWRVGVLGGKPLFVCQYTMAKHHWQIVKHQPNGKALEGGLRSMTIGEAPPEVIDIGLRAAQLIGNGLYGVDIKQTDDGFFVIEVNDNPNIEHGIEDAAEKDQVWIELTRWFVDRLEA
ncbi:RimK family protein [Kaistia dalseonensis]|uniref:Glutathione synthase/RimK-type ligase-like ATP-grasp enzyme n=1 Tax=Kaistia dalseonensis TaxID=410840 RepID=A0ABU0H5M5_9HYPH|nr:RimK family protein [Kaistia dalseonensis]MCX5495023.1 RimK family protein [Kaistia dalseonensis]MDQ0437604.1 glutathione synthase/RimK-type ligase-like ATP-grasp enzyme [Kaistia dalseonensis]